MSWWNRNSLVSLCVSRVLALLTSIENSLSSAPQSSEEATSQPSLPTSNVAYDDIEMQATKKITTTVINAQNEAAVAQWGKMILAYCFATSIALLAIYFQIQPHDLPLSFYVLSFTLLVSFSTSLLAQALSLRFPVTAGIHEQVGIGLAVITFFIAIDIMLPWTIKWIAWVICSFSLFLSFILYNHSNS